MEWNLNDYGRNLKLQNGEDTQYQDHYYYEDTRIIIIIITHTQLSWGAGSEAVAPVGSLKLNLRGDQRATSAPRRFRRAVVHWVKEFHPCFSRKSHT